MKFRKNSYKTYTISDLDRFLRQFYLNESLNLFAKISKSLFNRQKFFEYRNHNTDGISEWCLAFLSYRSLVKSNNYMPHKIRYSDFIIASYKFNGLQHPFDLKKDFAKFFTLLFDEQINVQEFTLLNHSSRYEIIYEKKPEINQWFKSIHGMSLLDYFGVGFSIIAISIAMDDIGVTFKPHQIYNITGASKNFKQVLSKFNVEKYLTINSTTEDKLKIFDNNINKGLPVGYERFSFNPIFRYPLFKQKDDSYLITNFHSLFKRTSQAAYWDLRDHFQKLNSQDFLNIFGEAFEDYCYDLLCLYFSKNNVKHIDKIFEWRNLNGNQKHGDFLINKDGAVFLFECKSRLMSFKARYDEKVLNKWTDEVYIEGIKQLNNTEVVLKSKKIINKQEVYKIILTLDDYRGECPEIKSKITNDENVFFMRVFELEVLEECIKKFGFKQILKEKIKVSKSSNIRDGFDFLSASRKLSSDLNMKNSMLSDKFHQNFKDLGIHLND